MEEKKEQKVSSSPSSPKATEGHGEHKAEVKTVENDIGQKTSSADPTSSKTTLGAGNTEKLGKQREKEMNSNQDNKKMKKQRKNKEKKAKQVKQKNKGRKVLFLARMSFLLALGSIFLLMLLPGKADEIKNIRTKSIAYRISGQDEVLLVKSLKETEAEREKLMTAFPNETTLLSFIKLMEGLRTEEVEILKSSLDSDLPTKIGKSSSFLPVTLMLEGKEEKIDEALTKIINSQYFVKVVNFNKEYDSNSEQVIASVQFHLFVADEF